VNSGVHAEVRVECEIREIGLKHGISRRIKGYSYRFRVPVLLVDAQEVYGQKGGRSSRFRKQRRRPFDDSIDIYISVSQRILESLAKCALPELNCHFNPRVGE